MSSWGDLGKKWGEASKEARMNSQNLRKDFDVEGSTISNNSCPIPTFTPVEVSQQKVNPPPQLPIQSPIPLFPQPTSPRRKGKKKPKRRSDIQTSNDIDILSHSVNRTSLLDELDPKPSAPVRESNIPESKPQSEPSENEGQLRSPRYASEPEPEVHDIEPILIYDPDCPLEAMEVPSTSPPLSESEPLQYTPTRTLSVASSDRENGLNNVNSDSQERKVKQELENTDRLLESQQANESMIALYNDEALAPLLGKLLLNEKNEASMVKDSVFNGFPNLLESGDFSDITLVVGPGKQEIKAHKNIICQRSGYFYAALMMDKNIDTLCLPDCHYDTLKVLLSYLYTGAMQILIHPGFVARLYVEAHFLKIAGLRSRLRRYFAGLIDGANESLPASYLVAMFQGISVVMKDSDDWGALEPVFKAAVARPEFVTWMNDPKFLAMLDGSPIVGRMLLQEHCRFHSSNCNL